MNLNEIETHLRTFIAARPHDPVIDPIAIRVAALDAQVQTARERHTQAQQAADDATLLAEQAYAKGAKVDTAARQRLRAAALEAEDDVGVMSRALEHVRRDRVKAVAARASRDVATLTPIFGDLISLADERAESLLQVMDLLELAHGAASGALPGASNALQQGYCSLLTRERVTWWRQRAEAAGLLKIDRQRVA